MQKVNLDALIPREDFEVSDSNQDAGTRKDTLSHIDLRKGEFFLSVLRKPDFQRETNEWSSTKICGFIESFLDGDLIPAVILWKSASNFIFVIDGSHRLSALSSWINDDYGDGDISKRFYDGIIPDEQIEAADRTRKAVARRIGSFKDYILALEYPSRVKSDILQRSKRLATLAIQLQWVQGDSSKAEASFLKINQQASPINETELRVLKARKQPNGIAARAIIRSGTGHKYWSAFPADQQATVENVAKEINSLLFNPELDSPIKTLDLPVGGKLYAAQSLPLVLDFINIVNNVPAGGTLPTDTDGLQTIKYLHSCRKVARRINSSHPGSLGLHPVVYFYSANGRHKIASFFAVTALVMYFETHNYLDRFTEVREKFESLLIEYDYLVQQIVRKYRGALPSYSHIRDFYLLCMQKLLEGKTIAQATDEIVKDSGYGYLSQPSDETEPSTQNFSRETKSAAFIKEALANPLRCKICGGLMHKNSISIDHVTRKQDGGSSSVDNAQLTHPYCNTTFKN